MDDEQDYEVPEVLLTFDLPEIGGAVWREEGWQLVWGNPALLRLLEACFGDACEGPGDPFGLQKLEQDLQDQYPSATVTIAELPEDDWPYPIVY